MQNQISNTECFFLKEEKGKTDRKQGEKKIDKMSERPKHYFPLPLNPNKTHSHCQKKRGTRSILGIFVASLPPIVFRKLILQMSFRCLLRFAICTIQVAKFALLSVKYCLIKREKALVGILLL